MLKLENKIEIIVPQEDNNGKEIASPAIKEAVNTVTKIAGGCTITEIIRQWWSDDEQRLMQDNNINLEWYFDKAMPEENKISFIKNLYKIMRQLIVFYAQEAVSVKINGTLYIIEYEDLELLSIELYERMFI